MLWAPCFTLPRHFSPHHPPLLQASQSWQDAHDVVWYNMRTNGRNRSHQEPLQGHSQLPTCSGLSDCLSRRSVCINFLLTASYSCPLHHWLAPAKRRPQITIKEQISSLGFLQVSCLWDELLVPRGPEGKVQNPGAPALRRRESPASSSKATGCLP